MMDDDRANKRVQSSGSRTVANRFMVDEKMNRASPTEMEAGESISSLNFVLR
jgi:hypothetical protein